MSQRAAKDGPGGVVGDEPADRTLGLLDPSAEIAERVALEVVDGDREPGHRALADLQSPRAQLFAVGELAGRESEHRLAADDLPEMRCLSQPLRQVTRCGQVVVR